MIPMMLQRLALLAASLIAWFVVLPAFVLIGGGGLFAYAAIAELIDSARAIKTETLDAASVRKVATRKCESRAV
jgi:hypothetical protein